LALLLFSQPGHVKRHYDQVVCASLAIDDVVTQQRFGPEAQPVKDLRRASLLGGFGPGESRFIEEKRHFEKPIPISEVVLLDRERCIQCARCTRFADEIAGDPLITFVDRADRTEVLNFPDHPFASYFSGNTVQICPVLMLWTH